MALPPLRTWKLETRDGIVHTVVLPSFQQIIKNPDGSDGAAVPLDGNSLILQTTAGPVTIPDPDITAAEIADDGFRFRTQAGQFVGKLVATPVSRIVVNGFIGGNAANIPLEQVVKFEAAS